MSTPAKTSHPSSQSNVTPSKSPAPSTPEKEPAEKPFDPNAPLEYGQVEPERSSGVTPEEKAEKEQEQSQEQSSAK